MATRRVATKTKPKATKPATKTKAKAPAKTTAKRTAKPKVVNVTDLTAAQLKAAAKKAKPTAKAKAPAKPKGPTKQERLEPKVLQLREKGLTWAQIAEKLKTDTPSVVLIYKKATVTPKQRKEFALEGEALANRIAKARNDENMSWFDLQARTGKSQSTLKRLYTEATGEDANQGFDVMRRMMASKTAVSGSKVKSKTADGKKVAAPAKRTAARNSRKKATGTPNPSKG